MDLERQRWVLVGSSLITPSSLWQECWWWKKLHSHIGKRDKGKIAKQILLRTWSFHKNRGCLIWKEHRFPLSQQPSLASGRTFQHSPTHLVLSADIVLIQVLFQKQFCWGSTGQLPCHACLASGLIYSLTLLRLDCSHIWIFTSFRTHFLIAFSITFYCTFHPLYLVSWRTCFWGWERTFRPYLLPAGIKFFL